MQVTGTATTPDLAMRNRRNGHLAMLAFSCLVAGSFSLGGLIANDIGPVALNAIRFCAAAVILGCLSQATGGIARKDFAQPWRYLILGGLFAVYFVMMFEGLKTANPVSASAVFTLTPFFSAIFGYIVMRQITTPRIALGLSVGAVGALWVIFRADLAAFLAFDVGRGEAIYFIGVVAHAIYTPLVPKLNRGQRTFVLTFFVVSVAAIVLLALGWRDLMQVDFASMRPIFWITLFYLTVIATVNTSSLLSFASVRLPASKVMAYTFLTPSWVILWEIALGKGAPSALVLGGVACTVFALLLLLKHE